MFDILILRKSNEGWVKSLPVRVRDSLLLSDIMGLTLLVGAVCFIAARVINVPAQAGTWQASTVLDLFSAWCLVSVGVIALVRRLFLTRLMYKAGELSKPEPRPHVDNRTLLRALLGWRSLAHIGLLFFSGLVVGGSMRLFVRPDTPMEALQDWRLATAVWFLFSLQAFMLPGPRGDANNTWRYILICMAFNGLGFALARMLSA